MAKGDVTMVFDAQTAAFHSQLEAARLKLLGTINTTRDLGNSVAKTGDTMLSLAPIIAGVGAAVGLATDVMESYFARMNARADLLLGKLQQLNEAVALGGNQGLAPGVISQISNLTTIGGMAVNQQTAAQQYGRIAETMGGRGRPEDIFSAMKSAQLGLAAGKGGDAAMAIGDNVALLSFLRSQGGSMAGKSDEDIQNMATALQQGGVTLDEQSMGMIERFKDPSQGVNMLAAARQSFQGDRALRTIQQLSEQDPAILGQIMAGNVSAVPIKDRGIVRALVTGAQGLSARGPVSLAGEAAAEQGLAASDPNIAALRTAAAIPALQDRLMGSTGLPDLPTKNAGQLTDLIYNTLNPTMDKYDLGGPGRQLAYWSFRGDPQGYAQWALSKEKMDDPGNATQINLLQQIVNTLQNIGRSPNATALKNGSQGQQ